MAQRDKTFAFQARIYKIWMMRHVDVPEEIGNALAKNCASRSGKGRKEKPPKHIPVIVTVAGKSHQTTMMPAGGGRYRLQIHTQLRKAAQADTGDLIGVSVRYDAGSRDVETPAELRAALKEHPKSWKEYERLPPGHKRQLLIYYLNAKSSKARERATARVIDHLLERAILGKKPSRKRSAKRASD